MDENVASVETTETEQTVSLEELQAELNRLKAENGKLLAMICRDMDGLILRCVRRSFV